MRGDLASIFTRMWQFGELEPDVCLCIGTAVTAWQACIFLGASLPKVAGDGSRFEVLGRLRWHPSAADNAVGPVTDAWLLMEIPGQSWPVATARAVRDKCNGRL